MSAALYMEKSKLIVVSGFIINAFFSEQQQRGSTKNKKSKKRKTKQSRNRSGKSNFPVGNYRLRRAERWKYVATVSSEVGEI